MTSTHTRSQTWAVRPISTVTSASSQSSSGYLNETRERPGVYSNPRPSRSLSSIAVDKTVVSRTTTFQWVRGELIGKGSYGRVYLALNVNSGELIAVKTVERDHADSRHKEVVEALKFESATLKELEHPNIVAYLGWEETMENLNIFLEYVPGGTIGSLLKHGKFQDNVTKFFTVQILAGLEYLHSTGIIHRDLKGDNILVEISGQVRISDFGISKRQDAKGQAFTELRGTIYWMAPEVVDSNKSGYDSKVDIWSLGCVVLEMWSGARPWAGEEVIAVMVKLYKDKLPPPVPPDIILDNLSSHFRDECFAMNPQARPTAGVLRQHPYLELTPGWVFELSDIERTSARPSTWNERGKGSHRKRNSSAPASRHRRTATDVPPPVPTKPEDPSSTMRPTDHLQLPPIDTSTLRPPSSRRRPSRPPSAEPPPIVYITPPSSPVRLSSRHSNSNSSTASGSTRTSARTSASPQPRKSFYVVNPDPDDDDERPGGLRRPFVYSPPPLPADKAPGPSSLSSLRSGRRAKELQSRASVGNLKAVPERRLAPAPSMQDLTGHIRNSSSQESTSRRDESYSESDNDSNVGMFWKKPPVELQKPSSSSKLVHRRSIIERKRESTWAPRPGRHDVYSHLQDFFPRVDLDKPIIAPSPAGQSDRQRKTKSIRMVAETHNNLDGPGLHRTATKLWGHKVEEVTN